MSLSARIAVRPSRRAALLGAVVAGGGAICVVLTIAARWPHWAVPVAALIAIVACHRAARPTVEHGPLTLSVSDEVEVRVATTTSAPDEPSWRLVAGTMLWPHFAVLALRQDGSGHVLRVPMFAAESAPDDHRAASRFLAWSLRGGVAR